MATKYTLKVYPAGGGRSIYRILEVCGTSSLDALCSAILRAFDFSQDHLYEFCMDNKMYSENSYEYGSATKKKLDSLYLVKGQKFSLHYDFGDDWMFTISVQKIEEIDKAVRPKMIGGKGELVQYPDFDEDDEYGEDDED